MKKSYLRNCSIGRLNSTTFNTLLSKILFDVEYGSLKKIKTAAVHLVLNSVRIMLAFQKPPTPLSMLGSSSPIVQLYSVSSPPPGLSVFTLSESDLI